MKKILLVIPITFLVLLLSTSLGNQNCLADTLDGSGLSILLIDGTDDGSEVTVIIYEIGDPGDMDYRINYGEWTPVPWSDSRATLPPSEGGNILDFRLSINDTDYYSYNSSDATLTYSVSIDASYAVNPSWWDDPFYGRLTVDWIGPANYEYVFSEGDLDGFAPVPIPKSLLLLGSGLLGVIGIGFRRRKSRIT